MYRFKIRKATNGQFWVQFVYSGQVLMWSELYTTKANAHGCISSIKTNALYAPIIDTTVGESAFGSRFEIAYGVNGQYFVRFKGPNGTTLVWSETYTAKHNAKNCAEALKYNALSAPVDDETLVGV